MSDRDQINRFPLGVLDSGERYVGCLHFRTGTSFTQAARLLHDLATLASQRFGDTVEVDDAEVCREYDYGSSQCLYDHPVTSALDAEREAEKGGRT